MSDLARILYDAAADVEQRGVLRQPVNSDSETCAVVALDNLTNDWGVCRRLLGIPYVKERHDDIQDVCPIAEWNDTRPSRAVVAAEMRAAAQLAELIGNRL